MLIFVYWATIHESKLCVKRKKTRMVTGVLSTEHERQQVKHRSSDTLRDCCNYIVTQMRHLTIL